MPAPSCPDQGVVWVALGSQARRELTLASTPPRARSCSSRARRRRGGSPSSSPAHGAVRDRRPAEAPTTPRAGRWPPPRTSWPCRCWPTGGRCGAPRREPLPVADGLARAIGSSASLASRCVHGQRADRFRGRRRAAARRASAATMLNIRQAAIIPIAALGRWAAAVADSEESSTPERLRAAAAEGVLRESQASTLAEAFELALRAAHRPPACSRSPRRRGARRSAGPGGHEPAHPQLPARRLPGRRGGGAGPAADEAVRVDAGAPRSRFAATAQPGDDLPWREARWCAVDLELTGLNPRSDEIIAIGAVPIEQGRRDARRVLYTLARPDKPPRGPAVLVHKLRVGRAGRRPAGQRGDRARCWTRWPAACPCSTPRWWSGRFWVGS